MSNPEAKYVSKAADLQVVLDYLSNRPYSEAITKTGLVEAVAALRRAIPLDQELKALAEQRAEEAKKAQVVEEESPNQAS